ncbi:MAG: FeoB-associated Cys-rich membrane protein [Flavobacteriales bacterium CG03_land_8_20_14_0_80_35_15]|nr:MAG: FeoB-associated Cys-rich membrane protein [Flavobacteriales bacterium CG11_big_fil_rev_8_21_14_0_20_35_7]PIV17601.1 MAG: FeoB-associated Cys-rich membrane protein [Flavobacteriales bacterium CG03_land_8_20_14_0_80_35_15]PIX06210.1 MAG: FeoB-associated Cys-rich membrane protein [Flavobacteriales bacterium CG_4_8_14_3_um_filter_35_10]PJA06300.1 MAG: FeoB-associated Cys-rich membrane protein [Flavobacteriales bacterium CG_4_10_14_0_2_um_filter_35_18]
MQNVFALIIVGLAAFYLLRKFIFKPKKKTGCGSDDCKCN